MEYKVIGVAHKSGVFEDKDTGKTYNYDNFNLHCTRKSKFVTGDCVELLKVKAETAAEIIADLGGDSGKLVGKTIDAEINKFGKVVVIDLVK
jgi:hypothetical protein